MEDWVAAAVAAYSECEPHEKCRLVRALPSVDVPLTRSCVPREPGRPRRPELLHPARVPKRRLGSEAGRAALVHAVAHIEFNAINLALDAALRFTGMPTQFHADWISVAIDEARHFEILTGRLAELGCGYGDLPAHNGLWEMAEKTAHDVLTRMALVPRVLEARGLDVTPGMIERLRGAGDARTVTALEVILREEVRHVAIGTRWFRYACERRQLDPDAAFLELLEQHVPSRRPGAELNLEARRRAGFSQQELVRLMS